MSSHDILFPTEPDVEPAERKLRICIIYGRTPLPMRRADQLTVAHLIAFLHARGHAVSLFYLDTGGQATEADREWLRQHTELCQAYKFGRWSVLRGLTRVLTERVPVQVGLFSHPQQIREVREHINNNEYDIVYTYYFRSAEVTKGLGFPAGTPKYQRAGRPASFLALQLSQTLNTKRIAKQAPNIPLKLFYEFESRLVERYESHVWRHFTKSVLIGKSDVEEIRTACRKNKQPEIDNFVFGAHGTDVTRFTPRKDIQVKPDHLVFSGVMRTPTNVQAVQWFAKNAWPAVLQERPNATWAIVGREPSAEVRELGKLPGVTVTGTVPDPALLISEAAVCINPMQAGGGMQNKLIEFMASGKAIVATSVANEGVSAPPGTLLIADSPTDFANAVIRLLSDRVLAEKLGHAARECILNDWTWKAHFLKLENAFYESIDN